MVEFETMISNNTSREQQKKLLHMFISKITINESMEIQSIELL